METATYVLSYPSRASVRNFYFLGDLHLGSSLCAEAELEKTIQGIRKDSNALVFLMGDLCDYIGVRDARFEDELIAEWVDRGDIIGSQLARLKEVLRPIAPKLLGTIDGNHESTIQREHSLRVKSQLVEAFPHLKDLSYSALVTLRLRRERGGTHTLRLYLHHGFGGGRTYAEANHYTEMFASYDCDWIILGHTHKKYAGDRVFLYMDARGRLQRKRKLWGRAGTFLQTLGRGAAGYGERRGYAPLPVGCLVVKYWPERDEWSWSG